MEIQGEGRNERFHGLKAFFKFLFVLRLLFLGINMCIEGMEIGLVQGQNGEVRVAPLEPSPSNRSC